jgi:hypothetical protein
LSILSRSAQQIQSGTLLSGCFPIAAEDRRTGLIAPGRSNEQRKINNVPDGIGAEQAGRFLNLLQVLRYHAERK